MSILVFHVVTLAFPEQVFGCIRWFDAEWKGGMGWWEFSGSTRSRANLVGHFSVCLCIQ